MPTFFQIRSGCHDALEALVKAKQPLIPGSTLRALAERVIWFVQFVLISIWPICSCFKCFSSDSVQWLTQSPCWEGHLRSHQFVVPAMLEEYLLLFLMTYSSFLYYKQNFYLINSAIQFKLSVHMISSQINQSCNMLFRIINIAEKQK